MYELKKLINSVTTQLYANAFIRCLLLAVSAFVLTSVFKQSSLIAPVLAAIVGLAIGAYVTKLYQNKKHARERAFILTVKLSKL